jgi:hypothetical protein
MTCAWPPRGPATSWAPGGESPRYTANSPSRAPGARNPRPH